MSMTIDSATDSATTFVQPGDLARLAYIRPTPASEARRLGILSAESEIPDGTLIYVLHGVDGRILGFAEAWDSAYGAALLDEWVPMSLH